jgi:putative PIN family toxin of toxin-antitoxin system
LVQAGILIEITENINLCRDPKDDMILELAVSGQADVIVSGDDDLLVLHPFRGISILAPEDALPK